MPRFSKRRLLLAFSVFVLLGLTAGAYAIGAPFVRSTGHFVPLEGEPRVRYEPGAEQLARAVAQALPQAIAAVEAGHFQPFVATPVVHVCATERSFERYGLRVAGAGGFVLNARLFISPKTQNTTERVARLLTHELSHLHLAQRLGFIGFARGLPGWFKEGLAVNVARGGGAENVSESEAWAAIGRGEVFRSAVRDSLLQPQTPARDGLTPHLFYRESALFVAFLAQRSPASYARFLHEIQNGRPFAEAIRENYGREVPLLWTEFVAQADAQKRESR